MQQSQEVFAKLTEALRAAGVGEICLTLLQPPRHPRFAKFLLDAETEARFAYT